VPYRLLGLGPRHGAVVRQALEGAARRLRDPGCAAIFEDFLDAAGAPLQRRLEAVRTSPPDYLARIVFADGFGHAFCARPDVVALTRPGSRVVYVCAPRFTALQGRDPARAEAVLLHEALHTLGLGEDPPASAEITRRVAARCGDARGGAGASGTVRPRARS
jgi:hypothetical protein